MDSLIAEQSTILLQFDLAYRQIGPRVTTWSSFNLILGQTDIILLTGIVAILLHDMHALYAYNALYGRMRAHLA